MRYEKEIKISKSLAKEINELLTEGNEDFGEDCTIVKTATFDNGYEMDIKCCGVQYDEDAEDNAAWTEAVLFHNGSEVAFTEPSDEYVGVWLLEANDNEYVVNVTVDEI